MYASRYLEVVISYTKLGIVYRSSSTAQVRHIHNIRNLDLESYNKSKRWNIEYEPPVQSFQLDAFNSSNLVSNNVSPNLKENNVQDTSVLALCSEMSSLPICESDQELDIILRKSDDAMFAGHVQMGG